MKLTIKENEDHKIVLDLENATITWYKNHIVKDSHILKEDDHSGDIYRIALEFINKMDKIVNTEELNDVLRTVANYFNISVTDIQSDSRKENVVIARAVYASLASLWIDVSYSQIGEFINRDHSTITYYINNLLPSWDKVFLPVSDLISIFDVSVSELNNLKNKVND